MAMNPTKVVITYLCVIFSINLFFLGTSSYGLAWARVSDANGDIYQTVNSLASSILQDPNFIVSFIGAIVTATAAGLLFGVPQYVLVMMALLSPFLMQFFRLGSLMNMLGAPAELAVVWTLLDCVMLYSFLTMVAGWMGWRQT